MVKISDIAARAGVSPITVSRVMNDNKAVKPETAKKVMEVVNELNYVPNLVARSLVTNCSKTIGVLLTNLENAIYTSILAGISQKARANGYDVIVYNAGSYDNALKGINVLLGKQVDGIVILPIEMPVKFTLDDYVAGVDKAGEFYVKLKTLLQNVITRYEKPIALLGHYHLGENMIFISADYKKGASMAVDYLASIGHKEIGILGHQFNKGLWADRYDGFYDSMIKNGLTARKEYEIKSFHEINDAYSEMIKFINTAKKLPTAIYCSNDIMAVGAVNACRDAGLRIPDDISIIGHDGSSCGEMVVPNLTTVSIHPFKSGEEAFAGLYKSLQTGKIPKACDIVVMSEIIVRGSTKNLKG